MPRNGSVEAKGAVLGKRVDCKAFQKEPSSANWAESYSPNSGKISRRVSRYEDEADAKGSHLRQREKGLLAEPQTGP